MTPVFRFGLVALTSATDPSPDEAVLLQVAKKAGAIKTIKNGCWDLTSRGELQNNVSWCNENCQSPPNLHPACADASGVHQHCVSVDCRTDSVCTYGKCGSESWQEQDGEICGGDTLYHCAKNGQIALTFDDDIQGDSMNTARLLNKLGVKATWFVSGSGSAGDSATRTSHLGNIPELYTLGHQVSSHTDNHCCLSDHASACPDVLPWGESWQVCDQSSNPRTITQKLKAWEVEIKNYSGADLQGRPGHGGWYWVRPPFMGMDKADVAEVEEAGYKVAWISDDTKDWKKDPKQIGDCLDSVVGLHSTASSHIVLQHGRDSGLVPEKHWAALVEQAKKNGWEFVTIDECAGL